MNNLEQKEKYQEIREKFLSNYTKEQLLELAKTINLYSKKDLVKIKENIMHNIEANKKINIININEQIKFLTLYQSNPEKIKEIVETKKFKYKDKRKLITNY